MTVAGFAELSKLKSLRVLDLSDCGIDLGVNEFYSLLLVHLKKMPKLEYISFIGNPVQASMPQFRYFVINELPKLRCVNWEVISKEDRAVAADLDNKATWGDKVRTFYFPDN